MQVQVIQRPLKYGGRRYEIDQRVEMTDKHARLFIAIGRVRLPKAPRPDIPASPSVPVTITETHEAPVEVETDTPADRPRRQYRRRDMRPESRDPQAED